MHDGKTTDGFGVLDIVLVRHGLAIGSIHGLTGKIIDDNVDDVVAVISGFRSVGVARPVAVCTDLDGGDEVIDLDAGVVVIELAVGLVVLSAE